jgi:hypothetical protein
MLVLISVYSCVTRPKTDIKDRFTVKVENESTDRGEFNTFFRLSRYVVLETTPQSLINSMDKVQFEDGRIYILSSRQNLVFVFDDTGRFIKVFNKYGRAPGEYTSITDFEVVDGCIHVFDDYQGLLMRYDGDGNYMMSEKIERGESFKLLPNGLRAVNVNNGSSHVDDKMTGHNYMVVKDEKLLYREIPYPVSILAKRRGSADAGRPAFFAHRDSLFALFTMNDRVYYVDKTTGLLNGYMHYVFPRPKPTYDAPDDEYLDYFEKQGEEGFYSDLECFMKFGEFDFVSYSEARRGKYVISRGYDLLFNGEVHDEENDLPISHLAYLDNTPDAEKQFVSKIHPYVLTQIMNSPRPGVNRELIAEIMSQTTEDGNPVLLFYDWVYER